MDYLLNLNRCSSQWMVFRVLNLIINGLPSKLKDSWVSATCFRVLNLIINGLPSKH